jgi:hypothetical protein
MKADVIQASLIVSIDKKYHDYLSKNFWSLRFPINAWGFNSHHLNHGLIIFYETGDKKWREEAIAHEIQHSNDYLAWNSSYNKETGHLNTEIVARIKEWRSKEQSKKDLLTELYDYFKDIKTSSPTEYKKRRDDYAWAVEKYVDIAFEVKKKYPENANFLLSFTNMSDWEDLL